MKANVKMYEIDFFVCCMQKCLRGSRVALFTLFNLMFVSRFYDLFLFFLNNAAVFFFGLFLLRQLLMRWIEKGKQVSPGDIQLSRV